MANKLKISLKRKCPDCGEEIQYSHKYYLNRAEKKNNKCGSCARKNINLGDSNPAKRLDVRKKISLSKMGEKNPAKRIEVRKKISESLKGRTLPINVRKKISEKMSNRSLSVEHRKNLRLARKNEIESIYGKMVANHNPEACKIIDEYGKKHNIMDLQHAENGGEFSIIGYFVDGYSPSKNMVIEVDETRHYDLNGCLRERDVTRQKEIEKHLKCKFIRIRI